MSASNPNGAALTVPTWPQWYAAATPQERERWQRGRRLRGLLDEGHVLTALLPYERAALKLFDAQQAGAWPPSSEVDRGV